MNVIQEAYINGVSTLKIEKLAKSLGIESISRGQVSQITKELNDQVAAFRERPLQEVFNKLKAQGLKNPWLVISDAHKGLINALYPINVLSTVIANLNRAIRHLVRTFIMLDG